MCIEMSGDDVVNSIVAVGIFMFFCIAAWKVL